MKGLDNDAKVELRNLYTRGAGDQRTTARTAGAAHYFLAGVKRRSLASDNVQLSRSCVRIGA